MEIDVYLHRTKKQKFEVAECLHMNLDFDKLSPEMLTDMDKLNRSFSNDVRQKAMCTMSVKKFGTGYLSFLRPQYEGPEEGNGTDTIYFDNKEMIFKLREVPRDGEK